MDQHINQPGVCQQDRIKILAESCDNEYYMSALGPPMGNLERAKRGYARIEQGVHDLELLRDNVGCAACKHEIELKIKRQRDGLREIERIWSDSM